TLVARSHHQSVNVHFFDDGNVRVARIVLDSVLLRYAGHVNETGLDQDKRDDYIVIGTRASRVFHSEDMAVELDQYTGHRELAQLI
ncbi:uncharacterized protein B0H64DRAFT_314939, partial [Chaetomium fimeti]